MCTMKGLIVVCLMVAAAFADFLDGPIPLTYTAGTSPELLYFDGGDCSVFTCLKGGASDKPYAFKAGSSISTQLAAKGQVNVTNVPSGCSPKIIIDVSGSEVYTVTLSSGVNNLGSTHYYDTTLASGDIATMYVECGTFTFTYSELQLFYFGCTELRT
jgi:hypothetical protein